VKWHTKATKTAAPKPPSYAAERISDIVHATEVSRTAPGDAKRLLAAVIGQLSAHHDDEFASKLGKAEGRMLDNPDLARQLMAEVIVGIQASVRRHDQERSNPWLKNKRT
jgi:hypothetical protein